MKTATDAAISKIESHNSEEATILIFVTSAGGIRVFTSGEVDDGIIGQGGGIYIADGTILADGSALAGGGTLDIVGVYPWISDTGVFDFGNFDGLSSISAVAEIEAPRIQIEIGNALNVNGRHQMSEILAREPILNSRVDIVLAFAGLTISDNLPLASFSVRKITEDEDSVILDCEGLAA